MSRRDRATLAFKFGQSGFIASSACPKNRIAESYRLRNISRKLPGIALLRTPKHYYYGAQMLKHLGRLHR